MAIQKLKKGAILLAHPHSIFGDIFSQSLIIIAEHNIDGTIGFILNQSTNYTISDLVPEISSDFKIYIGGPVEQENLYFLHNVPHLIPNSVKICENVYWGGNFDVIKHLLNANLLNSTDILFFLGYAGWGINQLVTEIREKNWLVINNTFSIFEQANVDWDKKILEQNPDFAFWINAPKNPSYN